MFTKYGYFTLGVVSVIVFILISLSFFFQNVYIKSSFIIIPLAFLLLTLNFFRDPDRTTPNKNNIIVSPADGRILIYKRC